MDSISQDNLALFSRGPVALFKWRNTDGWPVEYVSANIQDLLGRAPEEFLSGKTAYGEVLHPDDAERVGAEVEAAIEESLDSFEHAPYRIRHSDGSYRWLHDVTHIVREGDQVTHFLGYVLDITEQIESLDRQHNLEKQLLHAQKLESLGVLAGGVAHDFNNLLTSILGEASLARLDLDTPGGDVRGSIERIEQTARRAAELTRQLLAYSGKGRFVVQPLDLSVLVRDIASMLGVVISKKAALEFHLQDDLLAVMADRAQMQQIIMNLITNASDALGESAGLITIKTETATYSERRLQDLYGVDSLPPGDYVTLEVSDNGCGMTPEVRRRLFDPFFTTKAMGHGLGLSAILGIIRAHDGAIRVYSESGQGTAFKLIFPAIREKAVSPSVERLGSDWRGTGTALVVDDEPGVRLVARRMLEHMGFSTMIAENGEEALAIFKEHRADITLVLLDMMMPKLTGTETLRALRQLEPALPVVMSSGFNEQDAISRLAGRGLATFLQKPYEPADLEAAVRRALKPPR